MTQTENTNQPETQASVFHDPGPFYGDALERFRAMQNSVGGCDQAHFRMWCKIAADEIEMHRKHSATLLDALQGVLPILKAVRYQVGLGESQLKRMKQAEAALAKARGKA